MNTILSLSGQMPEQWREALAELKVDLGFTVGEGGLAVTCARGSELSVVCDGTAVSITWAQPVQFFRALSLIPQPLTPCDIHETPCFETVGPMFDCSRNAVLSTDTMRMFIRKMALMGLNLGMMYTEDTYEVPEQPFIGYKRGRYSYEELKALDDYAFQFGIELCPCIQALGHLNRILHWPALNHLRDQESVLIADVDETYVLLEQMIRAATAPYRSKRIHIGMDEAFGVGVGAHLDRFGFEDPRSVMGRHLTRVLEICDKLGLNAMMWSDMYFHLDGHHYHSEGWPSQRAIDAVDPRITLVYWDYYKADEEMYTKALERHAKFPVPTVFAGGLWTWPGPAPSYIDAIYNTVPGLEACRKAGIPLILATAWGDNGGECPMAAAMLALQLYGEYMYTARYDEEALYARFKRCCNGDAQAFLDLSQLNLLPGIHGNPGNPVNACKFLLYQDPLVQLFEADTKGIAMAEHFGALVPKYERYAKENPDYELMFTFYAALAKLLSLKCAWHEEAADVVRNGDTEAAARLAASMPATVAAADQLRSIWRTMWDSYNKPYGFEIIDFRLGGMRARLVTAGEKMEAFAKGEVTDIPELTSETLIYKRYTADTICCTNTMTEIVSACTYDF